MTCVIYVYLEYFYEYMPILSKVLIDIFCKTKRINGILTVFR